MVAAGTVICLWNLLTYAYAAAKCYILVVIGIGTGMTLLLMRIGAGLLMLLLPRRVMLVLIEHPAAVKALVMVAAMLWASHKAYPARSAGVSATPSARQTVAGSIVGGLRRRHAAKRTHVA